MQPFGRSIRFGTAMVAVLAGGTQVLLAQGVTSAAVQGRITSETRGSVENAIVVLTNTTNGARQQTTSKGAGRYNFENATPGGPYTIEVRAIGFQAATKTGVMLTLGQKYTQDFELKQQVVTLEELTVIAATNPLINSGRTGAAQTVSDTTIQRLPLLGRNFTSLLATSPQVMSGSSIGGQNNRFNTILIDGGVNNDIFGLSTGGTPGGSAGAKPISLEALQEFQILTAPFDIRQGSFSGGLVNGVTKSGTNEFHGSFFTYFQRPELVGADTGRARLTPQQAFDIKQYGGTLGGPIIKNKLHFFASADVQSSQRAFFGPEAREPSTGISEAFANRVQQIILDKYGFDPGGVTPPANLDRPDKNLFGKLTWQAGGSSQLELSYNYVSAGLDNFNRSARNDQTRDGWQLSNSGFRIANTTNTGRAKFTSLLGSKSLEVLLGYQTIRDARKIPNAVPLIMVEDNTGFFLAAGGERFSHGNELDQDNIEATANLTFGVGGNHQITIGTHNEFFKFRNLFANNRFSTWSFGDADSLEAGLARRYEVQVELRPDGFTSRFNVKQFGGYIQDVWNTSDRLTLTGGLRLDVPYTDKPVQNPLTQLVDTLGVNTGDFPNGNMMVSPRLGFNWDPFGNGNTIVRGGVGLFSGRPPYVWMSNAFTGTGLEQSTLTCTAVGSIPTFTVDVNNLPTTCAGSTTGASIPAATVVYFDKDFKFQQSLKYALGIDKRLWGGVVATFDFLHTEAKNQMYQTDDNVLLGAINGEGRQLYAAPIATASPSNTTACTATNQAICTKRLKKTGPNVAQVVHHLNKSADRSTLWSVQLQKSFESGLSFSGSYTHAKVEDLMTLGSSVATSNLRNTPLVGTLDNRELSRSAFDIPHKIALSGSANLPFGIRASMIYTARAGTPYAYVYNSDANGDGNIQNDLFYVPRDQGDIVLTVPTGSTAQAEWDKLNNYIVSEPCLREQRGRIMERGSCRNPWQKFLDLRLGKVIPTLSGQSLEITADVFNFLNLVNKDWGINRETNFFEQVTGWLTMSATQYDTRGTATPSDDRGVYTVPTAMPALNRALVESSRWRIQLGGKYIF
jgi:outer membrane receptor protein involved in Fe transport